MPGLMQVQTLTIDFQNAANNTYLALLSWSMPLFQHLQVENYVVLLHRKGNPDRNQEWKWNTVRSVQQAQSNTNANIKPKAIQIHYTLKCKVNRTNTDAMDVHTLQKQTTA